LTSVTGIVAPLLGTSVLGRVTNLPRDAVLVGAPFFVCAVLEGLAYLIAQHYFARHPRPATLTPKASEI
jgi:MFS transporter, DHA1 family, tetracycline resistance protein